ncbi:MAG: HEPN domain-containing protein [Candidatus Riflebacteria bacterium]|nr:HEPN domain-containing protein [Candidatus Riflebacteria bacterium]
MPMKKSTLRAFRDLTPAVVSLLETLEADSELRVGFLDELVKGLARERYTLAQNLLSACPGPTVTSTETDLRTSISRSYYFCHHACRAVLISKSRHDFKGHQDVVERIKKLARTDAAWTRCSRAIAALLDRRHSADYDPFDDGGSSTRFSVVTPEDDMKAIQAMVTDVKTQVETFLRNARVI